MPTKTFNVTACLPVTTTGEHNPGDLHIPLGVWAAGTGWRGRCLLKASISFSGMSRINEARLYLDRHTAVGYHAGGATTATGYAYRKTSDWSESSGGGGTGTDEVWSSGASSSLVEGAMADHIGGDEGGLQDGADGSAEAIDVTGIVRKWFEGSPNYGVMIRNANESSAASGKEFYSRRAGGHVPYFWVDYDTNTPPNGPDNLSPGGGEVVNTGRTITYSGTRDDPDSGDYITGVEIRVYEEGPGSLVQEVTYYPSGTPSTFSKALTLPSGYNADRVYEWRARTRDKADAWGPWGPYRTFRPNSVPNTPAAPTVDTDTLTPTITGTFADPDPGDAIQAGDVQVEQVSPVTMMWDPLAVPETTSPWSRVYAGPVLAWGTQYRARVRSQDALGAWSAYSAWRTFTPTMPVGPDNLTPRSTATKQNTLTPTLTVGHLGYQFRNDEVEVYAGPSLTATRLWSKVWDGADYALTNAKARPYAGAALAWGGTYYWRARIEDGAGVASAWSPLVPFYVNAEPLAPTGLVARDGNEAAPVTSGGAYVVTTTTPLLEAVFGDPDLDAYGDRPSSRTVEVYARNADGTAGALVQASTLASPPYTEPMAWTYAGAALVLGNAYLVRWRFTDTAGRVGPFSAYASVRVSSAPVVALVAPPAAAVVADQTPLLDWTFTGYGGKAQAAHQVQVFDRGPAAGPVEEESLVHDSGVMAGADTSYLVPPGVLANDRAYRWRLQVADSDGLTAALE